MKKYILLLLSLTIQVAYSQKGTVKTDVQDKPDTQKKKELISIIEIGGSREHDVDNLGIVDINSTLKISLDTERLAPIFAQNAKSNPQLVKKIKAYNFILENEVEMLHFFQKTVEESKLEDIQAEYGILFSDFYTRIIANPDISKVASKFAREFKSMDKTAKKAYPGGLEAYVFNQLSEEYRNSIKASLQLEEVKNTKLYVTAYITTEKEANKRVHVENFDTYADGEFYEVNPWVTSFSQEEVDEFKKNGEVAGKLNELVDKGFAGIKDKLLANLTSDDCLKGLIAEIQQKIANKSSFGADSDKAEDALMAIKQNIQDIYTKINALHNEGDTPGTTVNALESFNDASNAVKTAINDLPSQVAALNGLPASITAVLTTYKNKALECTSGDTALILNSIQSITNIFKSIKGSTEGLPGIGDQVTGYSLDDLPKYGYINLKNTGKRENGDELRIRVQIKKDVKPGTDPKDGNAVAITIDQKVLKLHQIGFHTVANVGVILANPFNESSKVKLEKDFQFAPSGSILFKFGSRTSRFWNTVDPGIGFNISTPDFDLDGSPEVGFGLVATVLRDIVSVGISYNTTTDTPYWFFGLSLPFSTFGVFNSSTVTTEK